MTIPTYLIFLTLSCAVKTLTHKTVPALGAACTFACNTLPATPNPEPTTKPAKVPAIAALILLPKCLVKIPFMLQLLQHLVINNRSSQG